MVRAVIDGNYMGNAMLQPVIISADKSADLEPSPIVADWILEGEPAARAKVLAMTQDKTARIMSWDCTPGVFNWHYDEEDEVIYIISGEVFISTGDGRESRLGPGDVALFPAGSSCTWRVTKPVRKVAFLRKRMPPLVSLGVRAWRKLLRTVGYGGISGFAPQHARS